MLNRLIHFSLRHRPFVLLAALVVLVLGAQALRELPLEVLPDMTKPTVTVLTEAPGLAPEEVEALVTQPLEAAIQGVAGLDRLRSSSDVGLSLIFAEFKWGMDIHRARQLVQERMQVTLAALPEGVQPGMTPVSSLMGEILLVGLHSTDGKVTPPDLRTLADWTLRRRIQSIAGVAEVLTIGGGVRQIQVQPDPQRLAAFGVSAGELETAVSRAAGNATSGYLQTASREIMIRNIAMTTDPQVIAQAVVKMAGERAVLIGDVAEVKHAVQTMRGDASVNGAPGVILSVDKAPGFDTLRVTADVEAALAELRPALPPGVVVEILFRQGDFIQHAIGNLKEAIRDGAVMVTIILFIFLLNLRTTAITLTAIPLSFAVTLLTFRFFDVSVNSMTLGGLAVAIGMVVDDAIVDVENVFRRLRENASRAVPRPHLEVIAAASGEVRNSILYATLIIILVFLPLLGLQAIEGRLFTPIAIATITSMAASFVVSLTVIPVLCSFLLRPRSGRGHHDAFLVRGMKAFVRHTFLRAALGAPLLVIALAGTLLIAALLLYPMMGKEFLPVFNEGSATVTLAAPPGTSLAQSNQLGEAGMRLLKEVDEIKSIGRRAGRAERDDHVMPVSVNEYDIEFHEGGRPRTEVFADIRARLAAIPGTFVNVGQPIGHRLSHMLSGVSAKIAVKIYGSDLEELRRVADQVRDIGLEIPGLTDVNAEPQVAIPQIRIEPHRERAIAYGVQPGALNEQVSAWLGGKTVAQVREGQRTMDLVLRLPESLRDSVDQVRQMPIQTGRGDRVPLHLVAHVREGEGPSVIHREHTQRRIAVSANTAQRDLETLVRQWEAAVRERVPLPEGVTLRFEGEFQAQQAAALRIGVYFLLVLLAAAVLLYGYFRSVSLSLQVMLNIPLALIGGLALTWWVVGNISIATIVGFIAVGGVAARNGIMMISHYLHLMRHEGESFSRVMIVRGTLERLVPVLMTALCAGIALIPLLLAAHQPGKEILHPVAVVIVGGLISSTLLDLMVTPAVFFLFGRKASQTVTSEDNPAAQ
jgi:CzcA family heavy metal efflux pump